MGQSNRFWLAQARHQKRISQNHAFNELSIRLMSQSKPKKNFPTDLSQFGYRALLNVALPLSATVGCFAITLFTDRTLLMWYGAVSSAASVTAGNLYWATVCIPVTAMGFVTPLVAMAVGSRQSTDDDGRKSEFFKAVNLRIWSLVWQSVWITLLFTPMLAVIAWFCPAMFTAFGHETELANQETWYFRTLLLVAPASMLEAGLTAFFVGQRLTKPILRINILVASLNVLLDVWLIFGGVGVPAMGVIGAALATALAMWIKVAIFAFILYRTRSFSRYRTAAWQPNLRMMAEIVLPGSTLGVQQLVRSSIFSFVLMTIGAASVNGLAATSAAISLYQLIAIPAIGLATAVTVISGQAFAAGGLALASHAVRKSVITGGLVALLTASLLALFPSELLELSIGGLEPDERSMVEPLAIKLMGFAALYCLADVAGLILGAAAKGIGKVASILVATVVPGVACVAFGVAFQTADEGATIFWWNVLISWALLQAIFIAISVWMAFPLEARDRVVNTYRAVR